MSIEQGPLGPTALALPRLPSLPSRSFADHERYIIQLRDVMRARECILLARIAELEAENASLRQHLRVAAGDILRLASTREALTNQLDALRADQDDDNA